MAVETDYHCLGVNSSALGWGTGYEDKKFTTGSMEFYGYMQSDSMSYENFRNMFGLIRGQVSKRAFSQEESRAIGQGALRVANAGVRGEMDMSYLNFSFQAPKFGGIAISVVDSYRMGAKINTSNAEVLFQGDWTDVLDSVSFAKDGDTSTIEYRSDIGSDTLQDIYALHLTSPLNFNDLTNGSSFNMAWNRYYNIGYGRKLFGKDSLFILYGGIGARYIQSVAQIDFLSDENGSYLMTSLPERYSEQESSAAGVNPFNFSSVGGFFPTPVGYGYGLDFSASAILFKKFKVAAAVNNVGSVTYKQKVYEGNEAKTQILEVDGLDPTNFENDIRELFSTDQLITLKEEREIVVPNAAVFRVGGSFKPIRHIEVSAEYIAPFSNANNLSLDNSVFAAGLELRPVKWLAITGGFWGGGVYKGQIPLGINFILRDGAYEFGFSSRDIYQFVESKSNSVSMAFGFARVRF